MKKFSCSFLILLMPLLVYAQNYSEMDQQQMQAMMQNAHKMQACMQNVDQAEMKNLEQQMKEMESEISQLCVAGKRSEAMDRALSYSEEMNNNSALQEMKKCGEMMEDMMPDLSKFTQLQEHDEDDSEAHICDD